MKYTASKTGFLMTLGLTMIQWQQEGLKMRGSANVPADVTHFGIQYSSNTNPLLQKTLVSTVFNGNVMEVLTPDLTIGETYEFVMVAADYDFSNEPDWTE